MYSGRGAQTSLAFHGAGEVLAELFNPEPGFGPRTYRASSDGLDGLGGDCDKGHSRGPILSPSLFLFSLPPLSFSLRFFSSYIAFVSALPRSPSRPPLLLFFFSLWDDTAMPQPGPTLPARNSQRANGGFNGESTSLILYRNRVSGNIKYL